MNYLKEMLPYKVNIKRIEQTLRDHLPMDSIEMVRDYTKGEYPYRYQLFNNRLNSKKRRQLNRMLPTTISKNFSATHGPEIEQIFTAIGGLGNSRTAGVS